MICPYCKHEAVREAVEAPVKLVYVKLGRELTCQNCKRTILLTRRVVNPKRNRPKHQSKKARLAAREKAATK